MSSLPASRRYTVDEYFELDESSDIRYEYVYGYTVAMAGASADHELIVANLCAEVRDKIKAKRECRMHGSNMRVQIQRNGRYAYPDAVAVCGTNEFGRNQTLLNPTVLFEVLSESTKVYDLGDKGKDYRKIVSLQAIVFVSQFEPSITVMERHGAEWHLQDYDGLSASARITTLECSIDLAEVYDKVEFPSERPMPLLPQNEDNE